MRCQPSGERRRNPARCGTALLLVTGLLPALAAAQSFTLTPVQPAQSACVGEEVLLDWRVFTVDGYNLPVSLNYPSLPTNVFSLGIFPTSVTPTPQGPSVFTRLVVGPGALGPQVISLRGIGGNGLTRFGNATLTRDASPGAPTPVAPEFGATTSTTPTFQWTGSVQAKIFRVQVALNDSFTPAEIIFERLLIDQPNPNMLTVDTPLPANTTLYWRVQGENHCGSGDFSPVFPIFTGGMCPPLAIAVPDGGTATHTFTVSDPAPLGDVDLLLQSDHARSGDLDIRLEHGATSVQLMAPGSCATAGVQAHFDDQADAQVATICQGQSPAVAGGVQPQQALSAFNGSSMQGTWTLRVTDTVVNGQSGQLLGGCLQPKAAAITDRLFGDGLESP